MSIYFSSDFKSKSDDLITDFSKLWEIFVSCNLLCEKTLVKFFDINLLDLNIWVVVTPFLLLENLKQHNVAIASWQRSVGIHKKQKYWAVTLAPCKNYYAKVIFSLGAEF